MPGSTIEAKLRIALEVAKAIAGLREFRGELKGAKADAAAAAGSTAAPAADKRQTDEAVALIKRRSQAERDAAAEAKRLAKEKGDADRAAAREQKRLADEEDKRRKAQQKDAAAADRLARDAESRAKRQQAYRAAQLAPQITDISVGLATGQNPVSVALQQGGQLIDIYGSARGALQAVLSVLTPLRVAVGAVAAGFGLLAFNIAAGYRESSQLNKSLALSGNIANTSLGQIDSLARRISAEQGAGIGFVRDVLAQLVATAGQTDTTLGATARAVTALAKLSGQSAEEAVKGFDDQAEGVTRWAVKANKAYNFLTAEQVAYIRSLEQQGRVAEAIKFSNEELAKSLEQRAGPAIGAIERAWNAAANAVGRFVDRIKEIGRDSSPAQRLDELKAKLAEIDAARAAQPAARLTRNYSDQARAQVLAEIETINRALARQSDDALRKRDAQDAIFRQSAEFQRILAEQDAAAAQKRLAQRQAELDAEQALIERAYAEQLTSAAARDLKLNKLDLQRAVAQQALVQAEIEAEKRRSGSLESLKDVEAAKATLTGLEARLVEAKARVSTALAAGTRLIDAELKRLDDEVRRRSAEAALLNVPRDVTEPAERARQVGEAATSQARKDLADAERDLRAAQELARTFPDSERLLPQLEQQVKLARAALVELTRKSELEDLFRQAQEQLAALALKEQELDLLVEQGALTTEQAERRKLAVRQLTLQQLREIQALLDKRAASPDEKNSAGGVRNRIGELSDQTTELERTLRGSLKSGAADFFKDIVKGSSSALEAFKKFVRGVADSMLNLITKRLGEQLVNSLWPPGAGGASALPGFLQTIFAPTNHAGGIVGAARGLARAVSPLVFAGAQIMHSGGIAGLRSNEVPTILEAGEEVLTADDPRHVRNFRGSGVNFQMSVTFNGASGSEADQRQSIEDLDRRVRGTIEVWAAEQSRQGGILAGRRRG